MKISVATVSIAFEERGQETTCDFFGTDGRARGREGNSPLPAARGPPTSWAQRRYLAEGKSLLDHPHRLLDAGAWATLFQGAHRVVVWVPQHETETGPL